MQNLNNAQTSERLTKPAHYCNLFLSNLSQPPRGKSAVRSTGPTFADFCSSKKGVSTHTLVPQRHCCLDLMLFGATTPLKITGGQMTILLEQVCFS